MRKFVCAHEHNHDGSISFIPCWSWTCVECANKKYRQFVPFLWAFLHFNVVLMLLFIDTFYHCLWSTLRSSNACPFLLPSLTASLSHALSLSLCVCFWIEFLLAANAVAIWIGAVVCRNNSPHRNNSMAHIANNYYHFWRVFQKWAELSSFCIDNVSFER